MPATYLSRYLAGEISVPRWKVKIDTLFAFLVAGQSSTHAVFSLMNTTNLVLYFCHGCHSSDLERFLPIEFTNFTITLRTMRFCLADAFLLGYHRFTAVLLSTQHSRSNSARPVHSSTDFHISIVLPPAFLGQNGNRPSTSNLARLRLVPKGRKGSNASFPSTTHPPTPSPTLGNTAQRQTTTRVLTHAQHHSIILYWQQQQ